MTTWKARQRPDLPVGFLPCRPSPPPPRPPPQPHLDTAPCGSSSSAGGPVTLGSCSRLYKDSDSISPLLALGVQGIEGLSSSASLWFGGVSLLLPAWEGPTFTECAQPPPRVHYGQGAGLTPRGTGQIQKPALASFLFPWAHFLSRSATLFSPCVFPQRFWSQTDIGAGVSCIRVVASSSPQGGPQRWGHSQGLQPPHHPSSQPRDRGTAGSSILP